MKTKIHNERNTGHNKFSCRPAQGAAPAHSKSRNILGMQLLIEMRDCLAERLDDIDWVREVMVEAARRAQATIVDVCFHKFSPLGVSGVVVIAESHMAIHTWPEYRYAAVDIFSCGRKLKASRAASFIIKQFGSTDPCVMKVQRGLFSPHMAHRAPPFVQLHEQAK